MKQHLFSVYDAKAAKYLPPFNSYNQSTAIRSFGSAIMDEHHDFHRHAHDYSLHIVGAFDDEKGTITPQTPEAIAQAHELLAQLELPSS